MHIIWYRIAAFVELVLLFVYMTPLIFDMSAMPELTYAIFIAAPTLFMSIMIWLIRSTDAEEKQLARSDAIAHPEGPIEAGFPGK